MPFAHSSYRIDELSLTASIQPGAYLYRLTSLNWGEPQYLLNGGGPLHSSDNGRFHVAHQRTTYCANNVLVCLSEMLFHMYRSVLNCIAKGRPVAAIREPTERYLWLTAAQVDVIDELVNLEALDFPRNYGPKMTGTMTVHPDSEYEEFQRLSTRLRGEDKRGIVYPSARHHRDYCFALFLDETRSVNVATFFRLKLALRLVGEEHNFNVEAGTGCFPDQHKIHGSLGYFEFQDPDKLTEAIQNSLINPNFLPAKGFVAFSRNPCSPYTSTVRML
jgi:RES domain